MQKQKNKGTHAVCQRAEVSRELTGDAPPCYNSDAQLRQLQQKLESNHSSQSSLLFSSTISWSKQYQQRLQGENKTKIQGSCSTEQQNKQNQSSLRNSCQRDSLMFSSMSSFGDNQSENLKRGENPGKIVHRRVQRDSDQSGHQKSLSEESKTNNNENNMGSHNYQSIVIEVDNVDTQDMLISQSNRESKELERNGDNLIEQQAPVEKAHNSIKRQVLNEKNREMSQQSLRNHPRKEVRDYFTIEQKIRRLEEKVSKIHTFEDQGEDSPRKSNSKNFLNTSNADSKDKKSESSLQIQQGNVGPQHQYSFSHDSNTCENTFTSANLDPQSEQNIYHGINIKDSIAKSFNNTTVQNVTKSYSPVCRSQLIDVNLRSGQNYESGNPFNRTVFENPLQDCQFRGRFKKQRKISEFGLVNNTQIDELSSDVQNNLMKNQMTEFSQRKNSKSKGKGYFWRKKNSHKQVSDRQNQLSQLPQIYQKRSKNNQITSNFHSKDKSLELSYITTRSSKHNILNSSKHSESRNINRQNNVKRVSKSPLSKSLSRKKSQQHCRSMSQKHSSHLNVCHFTNRVNSTKKFRENVIPNKSKSNSHTKGSVRSRTQRSVEKLMPKKQEILKLKDENCRLRNSNKEMLKKLNKSDKVKEKQKKVIQRQKEEIQMLRDLIEKLSVGKQLAAIRLR